MQADSPFKCNSYGSAIAQQRIQTGSKFEFDGFWWEPVAEGEPHRAQGHLVYEPSRGIELSIVDLHPEADFLKQPGSIPVLHGHTLEGKPCTLFDVIIRNSEGHLFSGHSRELLQSNRLVYGLHLRDIEEFQVDQCVVSVRGLREWVNHY